MPKHSFRKRTLRKKRVTKKRRPRSRFRKRLSRRRRKTRRGRSRFRKRLSRRGAGGAPKDKGFPNPIPDGLDTALTGDIDKFNMWFNKWLAKVKIEENNNDRKVNLRLYELAQRIYIALSVASLTSNPRYPVLEEPLEEKYNVVNKEFMGRGGNQLIKEQEFKDIKEEADVSIAEHKQRIEKNAYINVVPNGMKPTVSAQSFENWLERRLQNKTLNQKLDALYEIVPTIEAYIEETSGQPGSELIEKLKIAKNRLEQEKLEVPKEYFEKEKTIEKQVEEKVLKEHKERMKKKKEEADWEMQVAAIVLYEYYDNEKIVFLPGDKIKVGPEREGRGMAEISFEKGPPYKTWIPNNYYVLDSAKDVFISNLRTKIKRLKEDHNNMSRLKHAEKKKIREEVSDLEAQIRLILNSKPHAKSVNLLTRIRNQMVAAKTELEKGENLLSESEAASAAQYDPNTEGADADATAQKLGEKWWEWGGMDQLNKIKTRISNLEKAKKKLEESKN